jgi:ferredoxin
MCEYCLKHGDGQRWYLQAKNYSDDLLSDLSRRRFIEDFFRYPERVGRDLQRMKESYRLPRFVRRALSGWVTRQMKRVHFGQVVPLEELGQILEFANSVVRVPCYCRYIGLGREEAYCYGVTLSPDGGALGEVLRGLDGSFISGADGAGLEKLTPEQALEAWGHHEKEGLCHTVWTFHAPFIGGICNCDRNDCAAMQATVVHDFKVMFRGEWVAEVSPDFCTGCRSCMRVCQFGALGYSAADRKVRVDPLHCYGCGICRTACPHDAVTLRDRREVPAAANLW